jgi:hypothetical protein
MVMVGLGGKRYRSDWWSEKVRRRFLLWASYFVVVLYALILAVFIILSLFFPQIAADPAHIATLKDFIFYFSSPVLLFAILLVLWSKEK